MTMMWRNLSAVQKAEAVRPLALDGLSAKQIAADLSRVYGNVSRSAVIGVCNRGDIDLGNRGRPKRNSKKAVSVAAPKKAKPAPKPRKEEPKAPKPEAVVIPLPVREPEPEPTGGPLTIFQLNDRVCRWPVKSHSDEQIGGLYCGKRREHGAYCSTHAAIAYVPIEARRGKV